MTGGEDFNRCLFSHVGNLSFLDGMSAAEIRDMPMREYRDLFASNQQKLGYSAMDGNYTYQDTTRYGTARAKFVQTGDPDDLEAMLEHVSPDWPLENPVVLKQSKSPGPKAFLVCCLFAAATTVLMMAAPYGWWWL